MLRIFGHFRRSRLSKPNTFNHPIEKPPKLSIYRTKLQSFWGLPFLFYAWWRDCKIYHSMFWVQHFAAYVFRTRYSTVNGITSNFHLWQQAQGIKHHSRSFDMLQLTKDHQPKRQADPWWTWWDNIDHLKIKDDWEIGLWRLPKGGLHIHR